LVTVRMTSSTFWGGRCALVLKVQTLLTPLSLPCLVDSLILPSFYSNNKKLRLDRRKQVVLPCKYISHIPNPNQSKSNEEADDFILIFSS